MAPLTIGILPSIVMLFGPPVASAERPTLGYGIGTGPPGVGVLQTSGRTTLCPPLFGDGEDFLDGILVDHGVFPCNWSNGWRWRANRYAVVPALMVPLTPLGKKPPAVTATAGVVTPFAVVALAGGLR